MTIFFRAIRLLAMTVWVGGLVFFAFVEAQTAFHLMGATALFAQLIGQSIAKLNIMGNACGFLFLIGTIALWFRTDPRSRRLLPAEFLVVLGMMFATAIVQRGVVPAMERDRIAAGGDINTAPSASFERHNFDRLHSVSEKVEGAVLLLGLVNIVLMAAERGPQKRTSYI
jgi:putative copper export protein